MLTYKSKRVYKPSCKVSFLHPSKLINYGLIPKLVLKSRLYFVNNKIILILHPETLINFGMKEDKKYFIFEKTPEVYELVRRLKEEKGWTHRWSFEQAIKEYAKKHLTK